MKQFKLKVTSRETFGRGAARRLRAAGAIPACVYSKGNARSISLSAVNFRDLQRATGGAAALIGGGEKGINLQPLALEGSTGLGLSGGAAYLFLAPPN